MDVYDYLVIKKNKIEITFLKYDVCIKLPDSFYSDFEVTVKYYKNRKSEPVEKTYQLENLEDSFNFVYCGVNYSKNLEELDERFNLFYKEPEVQETNKKLSKRLLDKCGIHKL